MIQVFDTHKLPYKNAVLRAYLLNDKTTRINFFNWNGVDEPDDTEGFDTVITNESGYLCKTDRTQIQCLALKQSAIIQLSLDGGTSYGIEWVMHIGETSLTAKDIENNSLSWVDENGVTQYYNPLVQSKSLPDYAFNKDIDYDGMWEEDTINVSGDTSEIQLTKWTSVVNIAGDATATEFALYGYDTSMGNGLRAGHQILIHNETGNTVTLYYHLPDTAQHLESVTLTAGVYTSTLLSPLSTAVRFDPIQKLNFDPSIFIQDSEDNQGVSKGLMIRPYTSTMPYYRKFHYQYGGINYYAEPTNGLTRLIEMTGWGESIDTVTIENTADNPIRSGDFDLYMADEGASIVAQFDTSRPLDWNASGYVFQFLRQTETLIPGRTDGLPIYVYIYMSAEMFVSTRKMLRTILSSYAFDSFGASTLTVTFVLTMNNGHQFRFNWVSGTIAAIGAGTTLELSRGYVQAHHQSFVQKDSTVDEIYIEKLVPQGEGYYETRTFIYYPEST